jgi:hypothetical protein
MEYNFEFRLEAKTKSTLQIIEFKPLEHGRDTKY